jgi:hypothetical protein
MKLQVPARAYINGDIMACSDDPGDYVFCDTYNIEECCYIITMLKKSTNRCWSLKTDIVKGDFMLNCERAEWYRKLYAQYLKEKAEYSKKLGIIFGKEKQK